MDSVTVGVEIVRAMIEGIVDDRDSVSVSGNIDEKGILIRVTVARADMGRVIGKEAGTINAIRRYMHALGQKNEAFYSVKVAE